MQNTNLFFLFLCVIFFIFMLKNPRFSFKPKSLKRLIAIKLQKLKQKKIEKFKSYNICKKNLSDTEYLNHMISHHQVAIDISLKLQKISRNSTTQDILRKLVWTQKYEIEMMKRILKEYPYNVSKIKNNTKYDYSINDFIKPNKLDLTDTYCNPLFFDPEKHNHHLNNIKLDDIQYINHMIPHHNVAVDMSKILLKNTKNDFMIYLAYRIIRNQQKEIILLNDLKNNLYVNNTNLLN